MWKIFGFSWGAPNLANFDNDNVTDEVAETEIITMKMAETEEVVKSVENFRDFLGGTHPKKFKNIVLYGLKWFEMHCNNKSTLNTTKVVLTIMCSSDTVTFLLFLHYLS